MPVKNQLAIVLKRWQVMLSWLHSFARYRLKRSRRKVVEFMLLVAIAISMSVAVAAVAFSPPPSYTTLGASVDRTTIAQKPEPDFPLQPHPLPPTLAQWQDPQQSGDYFDQVEQVPVGYLIWTHFPITVYIQPPTAEELALPFSAKRSQTWVTAVSQAVQSWQSYLPLQLVTQADGADIAVWRTDRSALVLTPMQPDATSQADTASGQARPKQPTLPLSRARSAVTRYEIYAKPLTNDTATPMLAHRCTIQLRPDQAASYLQAAARHEFGHALGIWGHSQAQTDVMYFSQVRQPPPISARDLNTLKRIYAQPTRLGWALTE